MADISHREDFGTGTEGEVRKERRAEREVEGLQTVQIRTKRGQEEFEVAGFLEDGANAKRFQTRTSVGINEPAHYDKRNA